MGDVYTLYRYSNQIPIDFNYSTTIVSINMKWKLECPIFYKSTANISVNFSEEFELSFHPHTTLSLENSVFTQGVGITENQCKTLMVFFIFFRQTLKQFTVPYQCRWVKEGKRI